VLAVFGDETSFAEGGRLAQPSLPAWAFLKATAMVSRNSAVGLNSMTSVPAWSTGV
jgi:hypothetical protein